MSSVPENESSLGEIAQKLDKVVRFGRRTRRLVIGLTISLVIDLGLSGAFFWRLYVDHDTQLQQCAANNVARHQDIAVWHRFTADLAPPSVQTPKVRAELKALYVLINVKDTLRNCTAVYGGGVWSFLHT